MPTKARKARRSRKQRRGPLIQLSGAARLQLGGSVLAMLAIVTLLSLLSAAQGSLTAAWLGLLRRAFGWGRMVIPFGLGAAGVVLFMAGAGHPLTLPWRRVVGLILLFLTAQGLSHSLLYAPGSGSRAAAAVGAGGGYLGWSIQYVLWRAIGDLGSLFTLFLALAAALLLIVNRQPADLLAAGLGLWSGLTAWYRLRRVPVGGGLPPAQSAAANGSLLERLADPVLRPRPTPAPPRTEPAVARPPQGGPLSLRARGIGSMHEWRLPALAEILEEGKEQELSDVELRTKAHLIEQTLQHFGVNARVVEVNQGPTVTQFGVEPGFIERKDAKGRVVGRSKVKVRRIQALANDLALALAATSIRIEAPVPGRPMLGIEIPNDQKTPVTLRSVMESESFGRLTSRLRIALGIDVLGQAITADLATMPHLLIAGATGAGKSVCVNAIIACLLCGNTPDELRLIMIDPKRVELTGYNGIPHLLTPVVVDIERVVGTLKWVTREMDRRYEIFAEVGVRNIEGYNASAPGRGDPPFPYLAVFIDELADLMMVAPDEVERSVCRIAQMARATGIHLVISTQRPSVDVVTGLIKANFPARISFAVSTQIDSRVILDAPGAEQLLGRGDMLYMAPDANKLVRLQGCFVSDAEIERLVSYWRGQSAAQEGAPFEPAPTAMPVQQPLWEEAVRAEAEEGDTLLDEAIALVRSQNRASVSLLQRKLRIGYARAARIMDLLEERGVVSPAEGANHSREVLPVEEDAGGAEEAEPRAFEYQGDAE
jgi:S-DNA-T family DNA segregation ATPase FtsK/SpoIIIE